MARPPIRLALGVRRWKLATAASRRSLADLRPKGYDRKISSIGASRQARYFGSTVSITASREEFGLPPPTTVQWPSLTDIASPAPVAGSLDEVRHLFRSRLEGDATFQNFAKEREIDMATFERLIKLMVPSMGHEETKALFMSMDTSNDGVIQAAEIFSDVTMAILLNRMNVHVDHPLEGSYHCLPRPPFHDDPRQMQAISVLKTVFDEVVTAHAGPRPVPLAVPPSPPATPAASQGLFASMFGGVRRTKPQRAALTSPPPRAELVVPRPCGPKGAYLYGGCGAGKTVLLDLFFRSLPEGFTARRLHWHEFIRDAFRSMQGQPPGHNIFEAMADMLSKQFRVLLLDELLVTHISEAILVKNLFRQMWGRGMTIITTSNYLPEELYARGFNRDQFVDFIPDLEAQCPVIDMSSDKDYRRIGVEPTSDFFYYPITAGTSANMNNSFAHLVGEEVEQGVRVPIPAEGRSLVVPVSGTDVRGARVARFSFDDLCVQTLGRADYSVLAEKFHTIFIEGVPKFRPDLGAEFRRFVTLTDTIYGKKVALYLQSEVPVEDLFAEALRTGDLDVDEMWSFRRCSSMLAEMQNAKYHHMVWLMRNHMLQESALHL